MSEIYNPETRDYERLSYLTTEARRLRVARDRAVVPGERQVLQRQLTDLEKRIQTLQLRFRRRRP